MDTKKIGTLKKVLLETERGRLPACLERRRHYSEAKRIILTIPSDVTSICDGAFSAIGRFNSIVIPSSVTRIDAGVLWNPDLDEIVVENSNGNYSSIDGVLYDKNRTELIRYPMGKKGGLIIPSSVMSISEDAFLDCDWLEEIVVEKENKVYSSWNGVLYSKDRAELIKYPRGKSGDAIITSGVTNIGAFAFDGCVSFENVMIPVGVDSIGEGAFCGCESLENLTIPDSVTSIGDRAFQCCHLLERVRIPEGVKRIGEDAFYRAGLTSIILPSTVQSIDKGAFQECGSLTHIEIPSSVSSIGKCAFCSCGLRDSVVIPSSVTNIGEDAFAGCDGVDEFVVENGNENYSSLDGILYNKEQTELIKCPHGKSGEVIIPERVTNIKSYAFAGCGLIKSVTIPKSVVSIGKGAFENCVALENMVIPESVKEIGWNAFEGCCRLTNVQFPKDAKIIGSPMEDMPF